MVASAGQAGEAVLTVSGLGIDYKVGHVVSGAVRDVDFSLNPGEFLALVGESGSGKSTIARAVLGILPRNARIVSGRIALGGVDLTRLGGARRRRLVGSRIALVPQEPITAFDPTWRIGEQIAEALRIHRRVTWAEAREKVVSLLAEAGLDNPEENAQKYPFELSGGMLQRALIAAALIGDPDLIVADEPTSALDVVVQQRVLDRLCDMCALRKTAILFITHDIGVAADRADRIIALDHGRILKEGSAREVLGHENYAHILRELDRGPAPARERTAEEPTAAPSPPLLRVEKVTKRFSAATYRRSQSTDIIALNDVSLTLEAGKTLAVVGASGSGKSTLGKLILGLDAPSSGAIALADVRWTGADPVPRRRLAGRIQLIAQDTMGAFDPRWSVADIIEEPMIGDHRGDRAQRAGRVAALLDKVRLPVSILRRKAHELSGGQRQRLAIARALAAKPSLIVCDEPVSALDHAVQRQVLRLLTDVQRETGVALFFITHDLAVAREIATDVAVLYRGKIVEYGPTSRVFSFPQAAHTQALVSAVPGALFRQKRAEFKVA